MNGKCIFRGKKFFAPALFAAALSLALLFSCGGGSASSGDSYVSGDFGTSEGGTGGGENASNEGEGNGGENGNESGDGDEQSSTIDSVSDVLKLVMGDDYNRISGEFSSEGITLTAQTIKIVGENFSGLETYKGKEKKLNNISGTHQNFISNNKEAFVAQEKGLINITKSGSTYKLNSYTIPVKFSDEFNLSEISLPTTNDGKGDFSAATLIGSNISIDKLNAIRGTSLPTLQITNVTDQGTAGTPIVDAYKYVYNLYKDYSGVLSKLNIGGDFDGTEINGKKISGDTNYTLLSNANTVKSATDLSVKSLTIDALIQMYNQLGIKNFVNMIISETPTATTTVEVNWTLTNIVFEGDMSKIKNTGTSSLTGIVYFKKQAYKNTGNQKVYGLLKLDSLEGVSNGTFNVYLNASSAVLDVRGVGKKADSYTGGSILASGAYAHAIYFSNDLDSIKNSPTEINKLTNKFSNMQVTGMGFINVYLGSDRVNGESYGDDLNQSIIGAKNPRSLKEFEYLGNYYEDNGRYRFEKSAKETYGNEFDNLSPFDQGKLNSNPYTIALNNKRCFSSTAKSLG